MSLNLGFHMLPSMKELWNTVMKKHSGNTGLHGQALTRWLLFSMLLMWSDTVFREHWFMQSKYVWQRLHNNSRAMLNRYLNTLYMLYRKQLTLSRVTGISSQSHAPSITTVPLSFPVLGCDHTDRGKKGNHFHVETLPFPISTATAASLFHTCTQPQHG